MRSILALLAAAALVAVLASNAGANTVIYRINYPPAPEPQFGKGPVLNGPGGAKRVIVNLTAAEPNFAKPHPELTSVSSVVVKWSSPPVCGFPAVTINAATQFTLEWPSACVGAGHVAYVEVVSSGAQAGPTGSWKDAGGAEVSPAGIIVSNGAPVPGVNPAGMGAMAALLLAGGAFALRRRAGAPTL